MSRIATLAVSLAVLAISIGCSRGQQVQAPATAGCSAEQIAEWDDLQGDRMSAEGFDDETLAVHGDAKRYLGIRNWYAVADERQTVCGTFADEQLFDLLIDPSEYDWGIFLAPAPHFAFVVDPTQLPKKTGLKIGRCPGDTTRTCLDVEVGTEPTHFQNATVNGFLPKKPRESTLIEHPICASGPWVQDQIHRYHPELHPAEQLWWRFPAQSGPLHLMLVQDASHRFSDKNDFVFDGPVPAGFRTWTTDPTRGRFRLALQRLDTADPSVYDLEQLGAADIMSRPDFDRGDVTIQSNGETQIEIRKAADLRQRVGLDVEFSCQAPGRFLSIVRATMNAGDPSTERAGYLLLRLTPRPGLSPARGAAESSPGPPQARAEQPPPVELHIVTDTLRRSRVGNRDVFVADVEVRPSGTAAKVEGVRLQERASRSLGMRAAEPSQSGVVAKDVPLGTETKLEVQLSDGRRAVVPVAPVALVASMTEPQPLGLTDAADDAPAFAQASRLWRAGETLPGRIQRVAAWRMNAQPEYGVLREGRIAAEDVSPLSAALGDVVRSRKEDALERVFGTPVPFTAAWEVAAQTAEGRPAARPQTEWTKDAAVERGNLVVRTPAAAPKQVSRVTVRLRLQDALAGTATDEHVLWSHVVVSPNPESLRQAILEKFSVELTIPMEALSGRAAAADREGRRSASIIRAAVQRAAGDSMVTLEEARELGDLLDGLRAARGRGRGR
jgi:hypothetical protein